MRGVQVAALPRSPGDQDPSHGECGAVLSGAITELGAFSKAPHLLVLWSNRHALVPSRARRPRCEVVREECHVLTAMYASIHR